jgi:hypothetical protein
VTPSQETSNSVLNYRTTDAMSRSIWLFGDSSVLQKWNQVKSSAHWAILLLLSCLSSIMLIGDEYSHSERNVHRLLAVQPQITRHFRNGLTHHISREIMNGSMRNGCRSISLRVLLFAAWKLFAFSLFPWDFMNLLSIELFVFRLNDWRIISSYTRRFRTHHRSFISI